MRRTVHSAIGIATGLFVAVSALSGAGLAVAPVLDRMQHHAPALTDTSVATLAGAVVARYPQVESIRYSAAGEIVVAHVVDGRLQEVAFDPATGTDATPRAPGPVHAWLVDLHRAFASGDSVPGRALAGLAALAAVVLATSGAILLSGRMGGLRHVAAVVRGTRAQRSHVILGRAALAGLLFAAATGLYLSAGFFGVVPDSKAGLAEFPDTLTGDDPLPVTGLSALAAIPADQLELLVFPFEGDPFEPFEIRTRQGAGFVDQATGELASWRPLSAAERLHHLVRALHTGQGFWWVALLAGISALPMPILGVSGAMIWWRRRRARPRLRRNVPPESADTVILVGSEGNTTWGFAFALQDALSAAGSFVHVAPMNALDAQHLGDRRLFLLTATYGDGSAPASADSFLDRLKALDGTPERGFAVLGFGDREFAHFCSFAHDVAAAAAATGWHALCPMATVNRQSPQDFARWGETLGAALDTELRLVYVAETPRLTDFTLSRRKVFGDAAGAPTAILRFTPKHRRAMPAFEAGDLMAIVAPGASMPRYYSLGSSARDGFLEISVRRHPGGTCSGHLHDLVVGDTVRAFLRPNPEFHLRPGKSEVILVGSGCGIGVLAGFIRANRARRPIRLYYGTRDPSQDFLYSAEIQEWIAEGRLASRSLATTGNAARDLQHRIAEDSAALATAVAQGANIMIVGGREMAEAVQLAFQAVLEPAGFQVSTLRAEGRYVEDVF